MLLTHHVVEALRCKLSWHFLYCSFKHREGLLWKKQIKKEKVEDVCITEQGDPARGTGAGVTSHSSPAAVALTLWIRSVELGVVGSLVHTEPSRKGLSSESRLLRWLVWCHILILRIEAQVHMLRAEMVEGAGTTLSLKQMLRWDVRGSGTAPFLHRANYS